MTFCSKISLLPNPVTYYEPVSIVPFDNFHSLIWCTLTVHIQNVTLTRKKSSCMKLELMNFVELSEVLWMLHESWSIDERNKVCWLPWEQLHSSSSLVLPYSLVHLISLDLPFDRCIGARVRRGQSSNQWHGQHWHTGSYSKTSLLTSTFKKYRILWCIWYVQGY